MGNQWENAMELPHATISLACSQLTELTKEELGSNPKQMTD